MAGGGRDAAGHLADARAPGPGEPPRRRPRPCRREPDDAGCTVTTVSLEEQIDQWRSYLRRRQAIHSVDVAELEDHLREQVAVLADAGLDHRRGVPDRGEAHGRPRRPLAGVRARALGPPLEAARRVPLRHAASRRPRRERTPSSRSVSRSRRRWPSRCRRSSAWTWTRTPGSTPATSSLFVLPLLTGYFAWKRRARPQHASLAGAGVRRGGRVRQRLSVRPGRLDRGAHGAAPADRALARRGRRVRRRPLDARSRAAWTSSGSRASSSSTTC